MSSLHFECPCSALGWLNNQHKRWNTHLDWGARGRDGITSQNTENLDQDTFIDFQNKTPQLCSELFFRCEQCQFRINLGK